jgi:8-oxo-dGTP diphosphatase
MRWNEQGTIDNRRHTVVPRTLSFITHGRDVLLLRGAPTKRIWAGKLNGIGGHVEPDEDVYTSARREIAEEAGLEVETLTLRGILHISHPEVDPGVMLIVFTGQSSSKKVRCSPEGELLWRPLDALPETELVHDLPLLLPRLFAPGAHERMIYGHYVVDDAGEMTFRFEAP